MPLNPPPIRLCTRLLAALQTSVMARAIRLFDGDLDRAGIYALIARQTYPFELDEPGPVTSISAHSLAMSLSKPYETVRRHVNGLVEAGYCARGTDGVHASPAALQSPELLAFIQNAHDSAVRFVADLHDAGVPMPKVGASRPYRLAAGVQAATDLLLAVSDTNRPVHGDWMELVLFSTIYCANSQRLCRDRALARRHADGREAPPAELCDPVRTSAVARALGVPEPTVRRRVKMLVADGRVVLAGKRLLVSEDWLNQPQSIETSTRSFNTIRLVLARLGANGFPLAAPASAYLVGRPEDTVFG
jgi:hypothetical protein